MDRISLRLGCTSGFGLYFIDNTQRIIQPHLGRLVSVTKVPPAVQRPSRAVLFSWVGMGIRAKSEDEAVVRFRAGQPLGVGLVHPAREYEADTKPSFDPSCQPRDRH